MTTYTLTADWPALHAAVTALDQARRGAGRIFGSYSLYDAFGGTYFAPSFEVRGVIGLIAIREGLGRITRDAWDAVHSSARDARDRPADADGIKDRVRCAIRVMLAARSVYDLLVEAGVETSEEQSISRGYDDHHIYLQGLRWLAGHRTDDGQVSVDEARAIADGADFSILPERRADALPDPW